MSATYSIHFHAWFPEDVLEMLDYCWKELAMEFETAFFVSREDEMLAILVKNKTAETFH